MPKFEITNPEALKFIEDFKSGKILGPYIEKLKKLKMVFIGFGVFIFLLIFVLIGRSLARRAQNLDYTPPILEIETTITPPPAVSSYSDLKEQIFLFSVDLPDPIIPDISNTINLNPEVF